MPARIAALAAVTTTALLLATVVAPAFAIGGWRADIVALTVVAVGLVDGPTTGVRFGFASGLAQDLLSGSAQLVGLWALLLLLVGQLAGATRPYTNAAGATGRAVAAAALSGGALLAYGAADRLLGASLLGWDQLALGTLVIAGWAAALSPLVVRAVGAVLRRFPVSGRAAGAVDPVARGWVG